MNTLTNRYFRYIFSHFRFLLFCIPVIFSLVCCAGKQAQQLPDRQQSASEEELDLQFGGEYSTLSSEQQAVVDSWFEHFNRITGHNFDPESSYNEIPISTRTTFEAVTHALETTGLTDEDGNSLGSVLDIITVLETVHGNIPGAGGDEQFRIYAIVKPDTYDILQRSREFKRGADNTIYHKGYPINFRQKGNVPTMQISMTPDKRQVDIDVDYRSSKFPQALFNGHLTASNSDVRAGNNYDRHVNKWSGFTKWWGSIFGLRLTEEETDYQEVTEQKIPLHPNVKGKAKIEEAVNDFLVSWLVDQAPALASAYFSPASFECLKFLKESDAGTEKTLINKSFARYKIIAEMEKANRVLGKHSGLKELITNVEFKNPSLRPITHPYGDRFSLAEVPKDIGEAFICANRDRDWMDKIRIEGAKNYGKYYGAAFRLILDHDDLGEVMYMLWTKEDKYWKIVSFEVDPPLVNEMVPDTNPDRGKIDKIPVIYVEGDPQQILANREFLENWLVKQDYEASFYDIAPECYACVLLYNEDVQISPEQEGQFLKERLQQTRTFLPKTDRLSDIIESVEIHHPDFKIVEHAQKETFTIVSIPDYFGDKVDCKTAPGDDYFPPDSVPRVYGNYYITAVQMNLSGEDQAVLFLLWAQRFGEWKIIAYRIEAP